MPNLINIGAACDNIADWNNDNKSRVTDIKTLALSPEDMLAKLEATLFDCDRVFAQVEIIRAEIVQNPEDGKAV